MDNYRDQCEREAKEKGLNEGRKKGRKEGKIEVAIKLLEIMTPEQVAEITGLTIEEIKKYNNK